MKILVHTTALLTLLSTTAGAQTNAGNLTPEASLPFTITQVASFNLPWRIAFLPDGRMLITEKVGPVWLVTQQGEKTPVANVPAVFYERQLGMQGVFLSPRYATDHNVYLTYAEPGEGGSSLALVDISHSSEAPTPMSPSSLRNNSGRTVATANGSSSATPGSKPDVPTRSCGPMPTPPRPGPAAAS